MPASVREFRHVPIGELHEPEHAVRTEIDDDGLGSLADSIRALGVQEPIIVTPREAGGFEIVAGHRRYLAARLAHITEIPSLVETDKDVVAAIRIHENIEREELSPSDEAVFYAELYEQLGHDVDQVATTVRKSRDYVESRLLLMQGSEDVRETLRVGKISFGVALELNRMSTPADTAYYLEYAIRGGASIRQAKEWRATANARVELEAKRAAEAGGSDGGDGSPPQPLPAGPSYNSMAHPSELTGSTEKVRCLFCDTEHEQWRCYRKFVCQHCADTTLVPLMERLAAGRS